MSVEAVVDVEVSAEAVALSVAVESVEVVVVSLAPVADH